MDVDDVSHVRRWVQLLGTQKATLQANSRRKGELPKDRKPLEQLVREFMVQLLGQKMMAPDMNHLIHHSFVAPPYQPSTAAFGSLQQLYIQNLRLETHHRGFYIILRSVTPAMVLTGIMAIMEDEKGDGVSLQLYQQKTNRYQIADDILQEGRLCIIKEPYYKIMNDRSYGLRVDHVSDLIWLSMDDDRIPTAWLPRIQELDVDAMLLKEDGNRAFKAGKPYEAAKMYTEALRHVDTLEERRQIQINRAMAYLKTGHHDQSLQDAVPFKNSEKGLYHASRAFYELGRFRESCDTLRTLLTQFPDCSEATEQLTKAEHRLQEQEHGHYDFKLMHKAAACTPPRVDCGTYLGPVEIKSSEGCGRGLFTTRDVAVGELLMCEKAFSYCWADEGDNQLGSKTSVLMNATTKRVVIGTQADLITTVVQKLHRNPSLLPAFNALHRGDYNIVDATSIDGGAIMDSFLVDRIISLNVFGCPRTSLEDQLQKPLTPQQRTKEEVFHTSSLFINASYINHSCDSNATRSFIGDMQIVRATREISANTEIRFSYRNPNPDPSLSYQQTQDRFKTWGFTCTCAICEAIKTTPKKTFIKRKGLYLDLHEAFSARPTADLAKAERLLSALQKTYTAPASTVPRLALWDPYLLVTRLYSAQRNYLKTIETAWKALESLGYVIKREEPASLTSPFQIERWGLMQDHIIETWIHLWTAYAKFAPELCGKAEEYARIAYKICIGEDETFDERYGRLARRSIAGEADLLSAFQSMKF